MTLTVHCLAQVTETTESVETASVPAASVDVGDPEPVCGSSLRLSEPREENNVAATDTEMETNDTKAVNPVLPGSPSQMFETTETTDHGADPGGTVESEENHLEVKNENEEESVTAQDDTLEDDPEVDEDADTASDCITEFKDENVDTNEEDGAQREKTPVKEVKVSAADDLDEMMDIGTVDQMEQEAQMKEEQEMNSVTDGESGHSPAVSGMIKVSFSQRVCFNATMVYWCRIKTDLGAFRVTVTQT